MRLPRPFRLAMWGMLGLGSLAVLGLAALWWRMTPYPVAQLTFDGLMFWQERVLGASVIPLERVMPFEWERVCLINQGYYGGLETDDELSLMVGAKGFDPMELNLGWDWNGGYLVFINKQASFSIWFDKLRTHQDYGSIGGNMCLKRPLNLRYVKRGLYDLK